MADHGNPEQSTRPRSAASSVASAEAGTDDAVLLKNWPDRILGVICLLLLAGIVSIVLLQVVMRYVVNAPLAWSDEFARYQLVWLTFLGGGFAYRLRMHIAVDAVAELLEKRDLVSTRTVLETVTHAIMLVFAVVLIVAGWELVDSTWNRTTPSLGWPMGAVYLAVPLSGLIILLSAGHELLRGRLNRRRSAGTEI
jgi:TRAP-type C4-dicarboxylate transport system permease small subunit